MTGSCACPAGDEAQGGGKAKWTPPRKSGSPLTRASVDLVYFLMLTLFPHY